MILAALALAAAAPADTPRGFVATAYAQYRRPGFSPLQRPERWFAPRLTAAIAEDSRLARDEVGYLDGDPLCDCQDHRRIAARIAGYQRLTPGLASVRVHVDLGLGRARDLRLSVARTAAGWRIADVSDGAGKSLLRELERANARARP